MTDPEATDPSPPADRDDARPEQLWLAGLFLSAALLLLFGWLAEEVSEGDTQAFDRRIILLFRHAGDPANLLGPPWLPSMLRDLTSLGSTVILGLTLALVLGYLAITRKRMAMLFVFASVVTGQVLSTGLKLLFERPRPDLIPNAPEVFTASFPSGHAMLSAVTYLTLAALLTRIETRCRIQHYFMAAGILLTVLLGVSRVALGVHWPTDVAAGWCAGAAWATLCALIAARLARARDIERLP
ncbi:phosphatase PAP2 family protein [Methylobacterium sp. NEAU K]|uniref:phosphatase PAP2 family protein n=1 Tax=Methylobacterium sp. NEAU K TaxID=3064946 RepID=UPI0027375F12|nr:phosphatase PAP2 family protein [Methylobacterium sp. NEAU K]MDP4003547.1 phosphatase PAP2 family protein [Methylobacterium sp. NEAU K]